MVSLLHGNKPFSAILSRRNNHWLGFYEIESNIDKVFVFLRGCRVRTKRLIKIRSLFLLISISSCYRSLDQHGIKSIIMEQREL